MQGSVYVWAWGRSAVSGRRPFAHLMGPIRELLDALVCEEA